MAKTERKPNYTEEQVAVIKDRYLAEGNAALDAIAEAVGKSKRSVISKLVREGVYEPSPKGVSTNKDEGPSKKDLLNSLDESGFSSKGFEGATKEALSRILEFVNGSAE